MPTLEGSQGEMHATASIVWREHGGVLGCHVDEVQPSRKSILRRNSNLRPQPESRGGLEIRVSNFVRELVSWSDISSIWCSPILRCHIRTVPALPSARTQDLHYKRYFLPSAKPLLCIRSGRWFTLPRTSAVPIASYEWKLDTVCRS
jgi:hypothetical protein